jgi:3-oxoacyl-[acyl-carrier protein] reductase
MRDEGLIILGARGSLGAALCDATAQLCATRLLFDRMGDSSADVQACDLTVETEIDTAIQSIPIASHKLWRLVLATGAYNGSATKESSWAETRVSLQINLVGVAQFVILFIEAVYRTARQARIVVLSSAAARVGSHDTGYGIAKAGLDGLVHSVSKRYAQHGITIIGIAPGFFPSAMSQHQDAQRKRSAIAQGHLGRSVRMDEVLTCVRYALFEAPDALTGTFISPNGGQVS